MSAATERAFPQLFSQVFPPLLKTTDVAPLDRSQHRRVNRKFLAIKQAPEPAEECNWIFLESTAACESPMAPIREMDFFSASRQLVKMVRVIAAGSLPRLAK